MPDGVQNAMEIGWCDGRWTRTGARCDDSPQPPILALVCCVSTRGAICKELGSLAGHFGRASFAGTALWSGRWACRPIPRIEFGSGTWPTMVDCCRREAMGQLHTAACQPQGPRASRHCSNGMGQLDQKSTQSHRSWFVVKFLLDGQSGAGGVRAEAVRAEAVRAEAVRAKAMRAEAMRAEVVTCQGCEGRSAAATVSLGNKVAAAATLPWGMSAEENIVTSSVLNRVISFEPGRMSNLNWVSILGV